MTVADPNGDGKPDVTIASGSFGAVNVSVLLGDGLGTFQQERVVSSFVDITPQQSPISLATVNRTWLTPLEAQLMVSLRW